MRKGNEVKRVGAEEVVGEVVGEVVEELEEEETEKGGS